ncbi:MAG TPA: hypothetical protein VM305_09275 [Candidatus Limnocylindrales bacterium]|nr:hypothetical protein [Candidatus Limnocylindrales bacterium]
MSQFWRRAFNLLYRILAAVDPLVRAIWRRFGLGNTLELQVAGRAGGGHRSRLVGLLRTRRGWYVGHPNGHTGWTRDLEQAGEAELRWPDGRRVRVRAERVPRGREREGAIRATIQHPFPGNVIYWLGRSRVRAAGVFFRIHAGPTPQADR